MKELQDGHLNSGGFQAEWWFSTTPRRAGNIDFGCLRFPICRIGDTHLREAIAQRIA